MAQFNTLCVFCGSSKGNKKIYVEAAHQLAHVLAKANVELVYGGASVGIMGELANAMLANEGCVIGVIPKFILDKEIAHQDITELHVVESMHERKKLMVSLSDGFILMPGSVGSLEEFFEIVTWSQLGLHKKPFGILNVAGYYDHLIKLIDHSVEEGFLNAMYRDNIVVADTPEKLLQGFTQYQSPKIEKWSKELTEELV